jgi:Rrf2 family iron-sulfur cluster assembly transcriptional regulator
MGLQLTHGSDYAIRAMMYLAARPPAELSSLRDVGREQNIPESFLAKIFQNLVHAGLVVSKPGAHGGFALARSASRISVAQVMQAMNGPLSLNRCVLWPETCERSSSWHHAQGVGPRSGAPDGGAREGQLRRPGARASRWR